ncbi:RidA family protein [Pseudochelatococcus sp. B33]
MHKVLQPEGWARPIGYANGVEARGRTVFVGGQIGWNAQQQFETDDFTEQVRQTLTNVVAVLAEAGAGPQHITSLTWYFTDKEEYVANLKGVGQAYRDIIGKHFPAMAAVQVVALVEDRAKIEIQATAVIPDQ